MLKVGDSVRLIQLPENLPPGDDELPARSTFEKSLERVFSVSSFNDVGWAELSLENFTGSVRESIWIEPEYLEVVSS
jgi:hypothetical protein